MCSANRTPLEDYMAWNGCGKVNETRKNLEAVVPNTVYTVAEKNAFFQIIVTSFIFNIKNYVYTKITYNKCSFDYLL